MGKDVVSKPSVQGEVRSHEIQMANKRGREYTAMKSRLGEKGNDKVDAVEGIAAKCENHSRE